MGRPLAGSGRSVLPSCIGGKWRSRSRGSWSLPWLALPLPSSSHRRPSPSTVTIAPEELARPGRRSPISATWSTPTTPGIQPSRPDAASGVQADGELEPDGCARRRDGSGRRPRAGALPREHLGPRLQVLGSALHGRRRTRPRPSRWSSSRRPYRSGSSRSASSKTTGRSTPRPTSPRSRAIQSPVSQASASCSRTTSARSRSTTTTTRSARGTSRMRTATSSTRTATGRFRIRFRARAGTASPTLTATS